MWGHCSNRLCHLLYNTIRTNMTFKSSGSQMFYQIHAFFISKTFISNARLKLAKDHTLMLNFCYLKIMHILQPRYHPKIIGNVLKTNQNNKCVCIYQTIRLIIIQIKMKMKDRSHRYDLNWRGLDMDTNAVKIRSVSVWWYSCIK